MTVSRSVSESHGESFRAGHSIRVQVGPANYYSYPGAIGEISRIYGDAALSRGVWISGERAERAALPFLPEAYARSATRKFRFAGHVTHSFVDGVAGKLDGDTSLVVGIGGGGALDVAKAIAAKLDLPFVAIPTIAATCAAFTPLSVWYGDDGAALGYEIFRRPAELVLVEPRIVLAAPADYLKAGLADTLAKWYEADILCSRESSVPHTARLGLDISRSLRDTLLSKGDAAFVAHSRGELTEDFIEVVDAIIAGGGLVGGLGERYTRIAAAHSVHNGLSALSESAKYLHGLKVAYGILVQSAIYALREPEEASRAGEISRRGELHALSKQFRAIGLPTSLRDFGIDPADRAKISRFVEATLVARESIHLLPFAVTRDLLTAAIALVETARDEK